MRRYFLKLSFPVQVFLIQFFLILACAFFNLRHMILWDGDWYIHITQIGYSNFYSADPTVPNLGNVGFFPGYPFAGFLVQRILGLGGDGFPPEYALLIVSFTCAILSFHFLMKWLALHQDSFARPKVILLALYPFTIFFYYVYTESLFCLMVLGFFYYSELFIRSMAVKSGTGSNRGVTEQIQRSVRIRYFMLALAFGFYMNATRMLGVVLVLYPLIRAFQIGKAKLPALALWLGSSLSVVFFFIYCQIQFGAWDFYFITENKIWGTRVDWSKLFPPTILFDFSRPLRGDTTGKYVTLVLGGYLTYRLFKLLKERDWKNPLLALVLVSGMFWGENLIGRTSWDYAGMGRYLIPVMVLMLPFMEIKPRWNRKWIVVGIIFLSLQIAYALKFARHGWVA